MPTRSTTLADPGKRQFEKIKQTLMLLFSWARKQAIEEFSQNLGFRNPVLLETRKLMKTMCGPGTYDVDENVFKKKSCLVSENRGFGAQKRFQSTIKHNFPPPGKIDKM